MILVELLDKENKPILGNMHGQGFYNNYKTLKGFLKYQRNILINKLIQAQNYFKDKDLYFKIYNIPYEKRYLQNIENYAVRKIYINN